MTKGDAVTDEHCDRPFYEDCSFVYSTGQVVAESNAITQNKDQLSLSNHTATM